jgi:hypothetical protein
MQPTFSVRAPRSPRDAFQGEALGAGDRGALRRKAKDIALDEGARRRGRLLLQPGEDQGRPVVLYRGDEFQRTRGVRKAVERDQAVVVGIRREQRRRLY